MGEFPFDKQVGWNRARSQYVDPQGPTWKAVAQAGMNALGIEFERQVRIETLLMVVCTPGALSVRKARQMGVEGTARFVAEFRVPRETWEPVARRELQRLEGIFDTVDHGFIPDRVAIGDGGADERLTPGRSWQCDYCSFRDLCEMDGERPLSLMESALTTEILRREEGVA